MVSLREGRRSPSSARRAHRTLSRFRCSVVRNRGLAHHVHVLRHCGLVSCFHSKITSRQSFSDPFSSTGIEDTVVGFSGDLDSRTQLFSDPECPFVSVRADLRPGTRLVATFEAHMFTFGSSNAEKESKNRKTDRDMARNMEPNVVSAFGGSRRTHTKSRHGCSQCKSSHVKVGSRLAMYYSLF